MSSADKIEILAPAGSMDSLVAAVRSGADAVYVGEKSFSARASAKNFDPSELKDAADYCHIHGAKLYVTLNTIVFDDELERFKQAVIVAAKAGSDALIVQNMGAARLASKLVPELPLHASTQMSIHTASGARALYEMGFKRVVAAREMNRSELIKAAEIPIELEVFVHGALCMSVSGQCYFSAMLGSRSGNRGVCAQTCRLPFYINKKDGHALSLKDNSLVGYINDLQNIGVASAKIEGRMKRPEYVAAAVSACREQRDLGFISENTQHALKSVFSRTGFTDGYYKGNISSQMFGTRTRDDVTAADEKLLAEIRRSYKDEIKNVAISGSFAANASESAELKISDGVHTVSIRSDAPVEKAINTPLSAERALEQLQKTGGTVYRFKNLNIEIGEGLAIPASAMNKMRRAALEQLNRERAEINNYKIHDFDIFEGIEKYKPSKKSMRARFEGTKIGDAFKQAELIYVPLFSDIRELERLVAEGFKAAVEIPRGMFGREAQIQKQLERAYEVGIQDALCHNIGALFQAKQAGFKLHGGFGLNITNTYDLVWAQEYGLEDVTLSFELTFDKINRLGASIDRGVISYGYLPLMLCRACPARSEGISCKSCKKQSKMTDRKGKRFSLDCSGGGTEILNSVALSVDEKETSTLSTSFNILRFTVENYVENVETVADLKGFLMLKDKTTRGLYKRGVE